MKEVKAMKEGILVASSNSGRYAVDDPEHGQDLTGGQVLEIFLGGVWISGSIEHGGKLYATQA
ncbi:MAG TPA: DUF5348 domain-containing protein [Ktedonobacteraceae bacterium]|nr:DUF5348 domain-containing protein [Ktedonobacteraceae bacterium]